MVSSGTDVQFMMTVTWLAIPRDGVVCDVPVDIALPIAGVKWYPSSTYHSWLDAYYNLSSDDYNGRRIPRTANILPAASERTAVKPEPRSQDP